MNRAENSDSIPMDLILEILSRLPSKSVGRFHCVSKLWRSMLSGPYFAELYLTRSSARPRLLFAVYEVGGEVVHFYSSPQPQITHDKSALVVTADYHTTFRADTCSYASGLICFPGMYNSENGGLMPVICNPSTGQYANLPKQILDFAPKTFLGFDPIEKKFKVLVEHFERDYEILTLGVPTLGCRKNIDSSRDFKSCSNGICINGVIYYVAKKNGIRVVVCFDVRYEEFKVIKAECFCDVFPIRLINYKGKLGGVTWDHKNIGGTELRMWVLHDVEKQEWSKYVYLFPDDEVYNLHGFDVVGITARGEIVFSRIGGYGPLLYLFYFNPEKKTLKRVDIQGFGENVRYFLVFVDYVEDFNFLRRE